MGRYWSRGPRQRRIKRTRGSRRHATYFDVYGPRHIRPDSVGHLYRPASVMILGHSFVRRLEGFMLDHFGYNHNMGFSYNTAEVMFRGIGGRTVDKLESEDLPMIEHFRPDIVYLEMGTNDLANPSNRPEVIGSKLDDFANKCHAAGVGITILGQTIFRYPPNDERYTSKYTKFNKRVIDLNTYTSVVLDPTINDQAMYWRHIGLWNSKHPIIRIEDGVHLTDVGNYKYFKSVRGAIVHGLRKIDRKLRI